MDLFEFFFSLKFVSHLINDQLSITANDTFHGWTMIIIQQVYVYTFVCMYGMYMTMYMCLCQLASIHIVQCLSIKLLSDFGQSDISTTTEK